MVPIRPVANVKREGGQPSNPTRRMRVVRIGQQDKQMVRISTVSIIVNTNSCPFQFNRFFVCLYCKAQFVTIEELHQHNTNDHYNIDEFTVRRAIIALGRITPIKINMPDFTCKLCRNELANYDDLKNHLIGKHRKVIDLDNDGVVPYRMVDNTFTCARCGVMCDSYRQLTVHMSCHYSNSICEQCGARFPSEGRLKSHSVVHEHGSFPCEVCGKVYRTLMAKRDHVKVVHFNAKRNKCTFCPETFKDYYQKQKHLVDEHGQEKNRYKCGFCPKKFLTSSNMRAHERMAHEAGEKYCCDFCSYHTYDKYTLKMHMIRHNGEKNYKCKVCQKSYARSKTLAEHMKIHNNVRRFVCQYCDRAFVQNCSLKGHMKTHHRDIPNLECDV